MAVAALIQTNIKSKDWEHEHEWRLIVSNPQGFDFESYDEKGVLEKQYNRPGDHDRKMRYPFNAIRSVLLSHSTLNRYGVNVNWISGGEFAVVVTDCQLLKQLLSFLCCPLIRKRLLLDNNLDCHATVDMDITQLDEFTFRLILHPEDIRGNEQNQ